MIDVPDPSLTDLLRQIPISPAERAAFARADPDATATMVRILTAAAHYFNAHARFEYGGRPGAARDRGLVVQVVAAAFQTYAGEDPHPGRFDKAAMLLRGITQGHRSSTPISGPASWWRRTTSMRWGRRCRPIFPSRRWSHCVYASPPGKSGMCR